MFPKNGGIHMRKINHDEALSLIKQGYFPKCSISRILKPIRSEADLLQLQRLSSVQPYVLYGFSKSEILSFNTLPDDALPISLDEAIELIYDGVEVFAKVIGEKKLYSFLSSSEILEFYRRNLNLGNNVSLYWKE
mgnify:FL=1